MSAGRSRRAKLRRPLYRVGLAGILCAAVVAGVMPALPAPPAAAAPAVEDGPAPVNEVPDTAWVAPEGEPKLPETPSAERPPAHSPAGRALAAVEEEIADEVEDIDDALTDDRVTPDAPDPEVVDVDTETDIVLSERMADIMRDITPAPAPDTPRELRSGPGTATPAPAPTPTKSHVPETPAPESSDESEGEESGAAPDDPGEQDAENTPEADGDGDDRGAVLKAAASGCAPIPGVDYQATITIQNMVSPVWNNREGSYRIRVENQGTVSWPTGAAVTYQVFNTDGHLVTGSRPTTQIPGAVGANGGWYEFNAKVGALPPGTWLLAWDTYVPNVGWLSDRGVCSSNLQLTVPNQPPSLTYTAPASPGTVTTRTPHLAVRTNDPDAWPSPTALRHRFTICTNYALTAGCQSSASIAASTWQTPALEWGRTYYWSATVSDGDATTDGRSAIQSFTVVVPTPDDWRQVGDGLGFTDVAGLVLPYGVFVHRATDAEIVGGTFPVKIQRTFSSGALSTEGAFGKGWLSVFDSQMVWDDADNLLIVTYPDGRQEWFGRSGDEWISRSELGSTTRVTMPTSTRTVVQQPNGETVTFDTRTGRLLKIEREGAGSWDFAYSDGLATRITQQPSGRHIDIGWSTTGTDCSSSSRPTRPYVTQIDAGARAWTYAYSCSRLASVTDPMGGIHRYSTSGTGFSATTPEGRTLPGLVSPGSWRTEPRSWQERKVVLREPGAVDRTITLMRPLAGYESYYRSTYNSFNGVTAIYCGTRVERSGSEYCYDSFDTLEFDTVGRLRVKAQRENGVGPGTGTYRQWVYSQLTGRLTSTIDENWNVVAFSYDGWGNLSSSYTMRDSQEQVTSTSFYRPEDSDPLGPARLRGSQISPNQAGIYGGEFSNQYTYDVEGRLVAHDGPTVPGHPNGEQRSYAYTNGTEPAVNGNGVVITGKTMPPGLLHTETDAAGTTTYRYDDQGDLSVVEEPGGRTIVRAYDARGYLLHETVNGTARVEYLRDALGRVVREDGTCTYNEVTFDRTRLVVEREYDRDGLPTRVAERAVDCNTDGDAEPPRVTTFDYTAQGRPSRTTDAVGGVTTYTYSATDPQQLIGTTDARGRRTTHYYSDGRLYRTSADVGPVGSTSTVDLAWYQYDLTGRLIYETDALGRETIYEHTGDGYPTEALRPNVVIGGIRTAVPMWQRQYDGAGHITRETLGGQRTTTYLHDALGRVVSATLDPGGLNRTTTTERDAAGRVVGETLGNDTQQLRTTYELDSSGLRVAQHVWLDENLPLSTEYVRDKWGNAIQTIDPRGIANASLRGTYTSHAWADELGRVWETLGGTTRADHPAGTTGDDAYTTFRTYVSLEGSFVGYNAFGEITHTMDHQSGHTTEFVRDAAGRVIEEHLPDYRPTGTTDVIDAVIRYEYSAAGDLLRRIDPRGGVTEYEYDIAGNLVKERGPDGAGGRPEASHAYDAAGQLIESTSPNGLRTTYAYDALGRLVSETAHKRDDASDPSSATTAHATSYAYDAVGNRTSITTPQGRTTRFEHNAAGELTAVWLPGRTAPTRFEYDFAGRLVREIDPSGRAVEHVFDGAGREIETTQVGTAGTRLTTRTEYDAAGNVTAVTDPRGTTTRYDVDAGNRVTRITQPVDEHHSIEVEIGYDAQGNATRVRNGEGVDTWYRYNAWGLLERVIEAPTQRHPALADRSWMFHYDAAGNPIRESSPGGAVITRGFDAHNREVLRETDDLDNFATFEYDLGGRLISTETGWDRIELTWDDLDRLTTSTTGQDTHRFRYDADGLLVGDDSANFLLGGTSFSRDDSGAVVTTENASARGNYAWHDTYDDATGVLLSRAMRTPNYELGSTEWTYDEFGRTRTITNTTGPGAPEQDISYEYDANGNVTSKASRNDVHPGGDYAYDLANRLTHWTPKAAGSYPHQFQWDKAGNRASESVGAWFYEWRYDDRNRLERAVFDNDHEVTSTPIEVDARGNITEIGDRRLEYDDFDQLISDSGQEYTYDSLGRLTSRGDAEFDYAGLAIDPVVASDGAGGEEYAVRDEGGGLLATAGHYVGAGTTTRLALLDAHTDHTGGTTASGTGGTFGTRQGSSAFDPFGNRLGGSAPLLTPNGKASVFGFQSDWTDPATGAVHMGARWYDPSLGTFLSRDSADLPLTSHGGINRYSYGDANPLSNYDPTGRSAATLTDIATDWIDEIEDFLRLEWQFGQPAARPHPGAHPPAVPTGAPTIAQGVARKTFFAVAGRLALRAVPVIGWATLVADAVAFSQLLRPVAPPTGTTRPTPIPRPTPTPAPPVEDAPVTWERTVSESYSNASQRTALTTEGGLRVLTTTWLADLYRETRVDYSNGAWTWTREFVGRYVTDELREVLGRVIDPERIDQTHHTPTLTSGQQTSVGTQAQIDSQCGLSGTLTSCLTPGPVVASGCTGWDAPSRVCTPQAAVPGAAGATGPSTPAGQNAGKAPSGAAGSAGGSGGSGGGGSLYAEEDCGPDPDADENSGIVYRRKDSNGGEDYVGQAKSPNHYGARQKAHSRANPDALYTFDIIGNRPPGVQLDRLEEYYIRQGGGPTNRGNPDGGLANRRHQMNDQRYLDAGGDPC